MGTDGARKPSLSPPSSPALQAADARAEDVICLHGDVGMGKSVFSRAFIRAVARDPYLEVPSPTYLLQQIYGGAWFGAHARTRTHAAVCPSLFLDPTVYCVGWFLSIFSLSCIVSVAVWGVLSPHFPRSTHSVVRSKRIFNP